VITEIRDGPAVTLLPPERIEGFRKSITFIPKALTTNAEKEAYLDSYMEQMFCDIALKTDTGMEWTQLFKYPKKSPMGYKKSTIIAIKKLYKLPDETAQWVGKTVRYEMNGDYPKIAVELED